MQLYQELSLYSTDKKVTLYCDFQREIKVVLEIDLFSNSPRYSMSTFSQS